MTGRLVIDKSGQDGARGVHKPPQGAAAPAIYFPGQLKDLRVMLQISTGRPSSPSVHRRPGTLVGQTAGYNLCAALRQRGQNALADARVTARDHNPTTLQVKAGYASQPCGDPNQHPQQHTEEDRIAHGGRQAR